MTNKLNNTPIAKTTVLHHTGRFWKFTTFLVIYTLFTTTITYGVIVKNYAIPQTNCEAPQEINKAVFSPTQQDLERERLIKKVIAAYKVSKDKATKVVDLAMMHTSANTFPSPMLMIGLFWVESRFNERALSHKGASGIAQIMPANKSGHDTISNVYDSVRLLREYHEQLGTVPATLAAYEAGIGTVKSKKIKQSEYSSMVQAEVDKLKRI